MAEDLQFSFSKIEMVITEQLHGIRIPIFALLVYTSVNKRYSIPIAILCTQN